MTPTNLYEKAREIDPIEAIDQSIQCAWEKLSRAYDVSTCRPDFQYLLSGVDLANAEQAAQELVAAMLQEIMENVGRFTPWYRLPARAFGMYSMREPTTNQIHWLLAPEAVQKWRGILVELAGVIDRYRGLIQAVVMVEALMERAPEDPCLAASCGCDPPRLIYLRKSILDQVTIVCDNCQQVYA